MNNLSYLIPYNNYLILKQLNMKLKQLESDYSKWVEENALANLTQEEFDAMDVEFKNNIHKKDSEFKLNIFGMRNAILSEVNKLC